MNGKYKYIVDFYANGGTGYCNLTRNTKIETHADEREVVNAIEARGAKDVILKNYRLVREVE